MAQLKIYLIGKAERVISGLGLQVTMYATALKSVIEQFRQPSLSWGLYYEVSRQA
jgi:hypothetical protein